MNTNDNRIVIFSFATLCFLFIAACSGAHLEPADVSRSTKGRDLDGCIHAGCSNQLCVKEGEQVSTHCEWKEEYACYQQADCALNADTGKCEFVKNEALSQCLADAEKDPQASFPNDNGELDQGGCVHQGCSNARCGDANEVGRLATTCEWKEEYACYQQARCARDSNGKCGFVPTAELNECLSNAHADQNLLRQ